VIHIIRERATPQQIQEMLQDLGTYIKLAVDVERKILAGGGILHADCKAALLEDGSRQVSIWERTGIPLHKKSYLNHRSTFAHIKTTGHWKLSFPISVSK
jgi:hypothetical protein